MIAFLLSPIGRMFVVALAGVAMGFGGAWKVQGWRLDAVKAGAAAFQAQVAAEGRAAEKARLQDILDRQTISAGKEADHAKRYASQDARYRAAVAAARLSNANSGSGGSEPLSNAAAGLNCPNGQPDVAGKLAELEVGILALLERGDKAIERTITCKAWIDEQVARNPTLKLSTTLGGESIGK